MIYLEYQEMLIDGGIRKAYKSQCEYKFYIVFYTYDEKREVLEYTDKSIRDQEFANIVNMLKRKD